MKKAKNSGILDRNIVLESGKKALVMLHPRYQYRNPVMFVTYICAIATAFYALEHGLRHAVVWFDVQISAWLWFTVLFANFAQAIAESRGKAHAATLKMNKSQFFTTHPTDKELIAFIEEKLSRLLDGTAKCVIRRREDGELVFDDALSDKEKSVAIWSFQNGKESGWSSDTLPLADNLYVPLKGLQEVVGVLIFHPHSNSTLTLEQKNFLNSVCQQVANYVERAFALEKSKQHADIEFVERVNKSVLERISRAFEGLILATRAAISQLKSKIGMMRRGDLSEVGGIEATFETFVTILTNFSAFAQLSEGMLPLKEGKHSVADFLQDCCDHLQKVSEDLELRVNVEENLSEVTFDYHLIQMVVFILILNAMERAPKTAIHVDAKRNKGFLTISVSDSGTSLTEKEIETLFEGLIPGTEADLTGRRPGLVVAKTIVEIHRGSMAVENIPDIGVQFTFHLPMP